MLTLWEPVLVPRGEPSSEFLPMDPFMPILHIMWPMGPRAHEPWGSWAEDAAVSHSPLRSARAAALSRAGLDVADVDEASRSVSMWAAQSMEELPNACHSPCGHGKRGLAQSQAWGPKPPTYSPEGCPEKTTLYV
jgi:hypothetical protein